MVEVMLTAWGEQLDSLNPLPDYPRPQMVRADWIAPGAHINIVGSSSRDAVEVSPAVIARSRVFVDYFPATMALGGDINEAIALGLIRQADLAGEIGAVLAGSLTGRRSPDEITARENCVEDQPPRRRWLH